MKKPFLFAVGFLSCLSSASFAMGSGTPADSNPGGVSDPAQVITNFSEVSPGIYRGARPMNEGLESLAKIGVRSIINLQGGDLTSPVPSWIVERMEPGELPENIAAEKKTAQSLGMTFVSAPLDSLQDVTPAEDRLIDRALEFMADPKNQPVFVHCEHGKDRTGMLIALYEVKYLGEDIEKAHDEMIAHGHGTLNQIFTHDMDEYFYSKAKEIAASRADR